MLLSDSRNSPFALISHMFVTILWKLTSQHHIHDMYYLLIWINPAILNYHQRVQVIYQASFWNTYNKGKQRFIHPIIIHM